MIKETDASKNDERRVKNKLNPLTHKRKGETRTMYNQSTKHWQLGMFFVISLMLMVGLFANITLAHDVPDTADTDLDDTKIGEVKITSTVTADSMVDLEIRYEATELHDLAAIGEVTYMVDDPSTTDIDESVNTEGEKIVTANSSTYGRIQITLPAGWGPDNTAIDPNGITDTIHQDHVSGYPNATYLSYTIKSSSAKIEVAEGNNADGDSKEDDDKTAANDERGLDVSGTQAAGWIITIDVDNLKNNHYVVLTINNLMIPALRMGTDPLDPLDRISRTTDITTEMLDRAMEEVVVLSESDTRFNSRRRYPDWGTS